MREQPAVRAVHPRGSPTMLTATSSHRPGQPWSVNSLALIALAACARDATTPARVAAEVAAARAELAAGLAACRACGMAISRQRPALARPERPGGPRRVGRAAHRRPPRRHLPRPGADHLCVAVRRPDDNRRLLAALAAKLR